MELHCKQYRANCPECVCVYVYIYIFIYSQMLKVKCTELAIRELKLRSSLLRQLAVQSCLPLRVCSVLEVVLGVNYGI